jgi:precorrin-6B methylase 2
MSMSIFIIVVAVLALTFWPAISFAPYVGSSRSKVRRALAVAGLQPGETLYDLGCGDGRVLLIASHTFGARAVGVELSIPIFLLAKIKCRLLRASEVEVRLGNMFKADISDADVIFLYGVPATLKHTVRQKLERELKPGARVVSYCFPIQGWEAVTVEQGGWGGEIYLYRQPG